MQFTFHSNVVRYCSLLLLINILSAKYAQLLFLFFLDFHNFNFPFITFCKTFIMDANECEAIRVCSLMNVIPPEIRVIVSKRRILSGSARGFTSKITTYEGLCWPDILELNLNTLLICLEFQQENGGVDYLVIPLITDCSRWINRIHSSQNQYYHRRNQKQIWLEWSLQQCQRLCKLLFTFNYPRFTVPPRR